MSTTIILTSTVNVHNKSFLYQTDPWERLECYLLSVRQWLTKTKLNIVLVENSGYTFPELKQELVDYKERFEIISFDESIIAPELTGNLSKGASELFAIYNALRVSCIIQTKTNFVIKITARYFIPELENYLKNIDLNTYSVLTQNNPSCCEMVGCHMKNVDIMFHPIPINQYGHYEAHIESVYRFRGEQFTNVLHCKPFPIEPTVRGGFPKNEPLSVV
jgi:hypothetical protein